LLVVDDDGTGFLSAEQADGYGRFAGVPSVEDLERFFFLDDADLKLVRVRRGPASRLGFEVGQVGVWVGLGQPSIQVGGFLSRG
jgi:hypothetical protein